ncbi:unnamed protein product, partial [Ectocarpus sp. 6 AP-2014]
ARFHLFSVCTSRHGQSPRNNQQSSVRQEHTTPPPPNTLSVQCDSRARPDPLVHHVSHRGRDPGFPHGGDRSPEQRGGALLPQHGLQRVNGSRVLGENAVGRV